MNLYSDDFKDGDRLVDKHAYSRENMSPSLKWDNVPDGTVEFAIICDDPDAPVGNWVHWVLYGLPTITEELETGISRDKVLHSLGGVKQGKNGWGNIGYDGPHPPPGPNHRYIFQLFALSKAVDLGPGANADQLRRAMQGVILVEVKITGLYSR